MSDILTLAAVRKIVCSRNLYKIALRKNTLLGIPQINAALILECLHRYLLFKSALNISNYSYLKCYLTTICLDNSEKSRLSCNTYIGI